MRNETKEHLWKIIQQCLIKIVFWDFIFPVINYCLLLLIGKGTSVAQSNFFGHFLRQKSTKQHSFKQSKKHLHLELFRTKVHLWLLTN